MGTPLIVGLLLDAQDEFGSLVDRLGDAIDGRVDGLNEPAWVIAHAAFFHDCWLNGDAQGRPREQWDPWLVGWADRQRDASPNVIATPLAEARAAWHRITEPVTAFCSRLREPDLEAVPPYEEGAWPAGTTVGYLVARSVAHLFAHASELNVIATAAGLPDAGLPGRMAATRSV